MLTFGSWLWKDFIDLCVCVSMCVTLRGFSCCHIVMSEENRVSSVRLLVVYFRYLLVYFRYLFFFFWFGFCVYVARRSICRLTVRTSMLLGEYRGLSQSGRGIPDSSLLALFPFFSVFSPQNPRECLFVCLITARMHGWRKVASI